MPNNTSFIGRENELQSLNRLLTKKSASLVVIRGRRRIGKSRLVEEFTKGKNRFYFSGLAPTDRTTKQSELNEFARQLSSATGLPEIKADDWSKLFQLLADRATKGKIIIAFDEVSWMGTKDPDFLGKLKNAWDLHFKSNPNLILILCGSVSSWIEKNILSSTAFFGRISLKISLDDLPIQDCDRLLSQIGFKRSPLEKLIILSVVGGIPWYLEQIDPQASSHENIKRLCFTKDGLLVDEFRYIFHDLFGRRRKTCQDIVEVLAKGPEENKDIAKAIGYSVGGPLSEYLEDLVISGFISRDFTWSFKSGNSSRLSHYRLSDNYLRFYMKCISPRFNKIKKDQFAETDLNAILNNSSSIFGLQFENLVLRNRKIIQKELGIKPEEIVADNPFFQRKTSKTQGCQIDYLIQTNLKTLFACEIKYSKNEIKPKVIDEMREKLKRLSMPKGFSCVPILIHMGDVSDAVIESGYFYQIIDLEKFFTVK